MGRWSVYTPHYEQLFSKFFYDLTRRKKVLLDRDTSTGHYNYEWTEDTVTGIIIPRGGTVLGFPVGVVMRMDGALVTLDGFKTGWQVYDPFLEQYWEIQAVQEFRAPRMIDPNTGFAYRICDLHLLPLFKNIP
jgi:hypothetical protein